MDSCDKESVHLIRNLFFSVILKYTACSLTLTLNYLHFLHV